VSRQVPFSSDPGTLPPYREGHGCPDCAVAFALLGLAVPRLRLPRPQGIAARSLT